MSPLLAPLFAQLVGLQLGDRTEGRYIKYSGDRFEGSTTPSVMLFLTERRSNFALTYSPNLLFVPGEAAGQRLFVFHQSSAAAGYRLKRSSFSLGSSLSLGQVNFRVAGLQGLTTTGANANGTPATGTDGTDGTGGTDTTTDTGGATPAAGSNAPGAMVGAPNPNAQSGQLRVANQTVSYYSSVTTFGVAHQVSKSVQLSGQIAHNRAGGLDEESRATYPTLSGWLVGATGSYTYRLSARDSFTSSASLMQAWSSTLNRAATLTASETWSHQFDKRTFSALGAGINITRFTQVTGLEGFSIFPTFQAALGHRAPLARGALTMIVSSYSTPALDTLRGLVDPRVGVAASVDYTHKPFSLGASAASAISVAPSGNNAGAVNASQGEAHAAYRIAPLVQMDAGTRYSRQSFQSVTTIPSSWSVFVGLSFGYRLTNAADPKK